MKLAALDNITPGMVLAQDVFLAGDTENAFLTKGTVLTEILIALLRDNSFNEILVHITRPVAPLEARNAMLQRVSTTLSQTGPAISAELRISALDTLQHTFDEVSISDAGIFGSHDDANRLESVIDGLVSSLSRQHDITLNIRDLKSYDDYTFHHSLSVAVLAIGIAQQLGMPNSELRQLGLAAIMHDIGKTAVPIEIIQKPSRLTPFEFQVVQTHSPAGANYLITTNIGNEQMWKAVLHHHERLDGKGYPDGLKGNDIPFWSRIIAAADVYDALTSNRPYRAASQPAEALEFLMGGVGSAFDYDVVSALINTVDVYPVGSFIELSNGEVALVLNNEKQMRPIIELVDSKEIVNLAEDRSYLSVVVKRIVPDNELATMPYAK